MVAISVLLIIMVGAINVANIWMNASQAEQRLGMLLDNELRMHQNTINMEETRPEMTKPDTINIEETRSFSNRPLGIFHRPIDEDTAMSLRFFTAQANAEGKVIRLDVSRISSVTEDEAKRFASEVFGQQHTAGYTHSFKYGVETLENGGNPEASGGKVAVFLDISAQRQSVLMVLVSSAAILIAGWLLMLLLVIRLSRRAILPIAKNIERQKQFVTDAGHEIKTPLAIIQANVDAMELINGENKYSKNIRAQALRLSGLMQNLLTLARMEETDRKLPVSDLSVSKLAEETLEPFYESAALRGIQIESEIQPQVHMSGNREQLQRLMSILLDNAVKYTDTDGRITVSLQKKEKSVIFQVKNTCEELPRVEPDKLFDRFYRADSARTQKSGGYGIGLSAARAIVAAQKGSIRARYEDERTIAFTVRF